MNKNKNEYFKYSNSTNHSQLESLEEFAMEEDMTETQPEKEGDQQFNTQNFYNRQHYVGKRIVSKHENKK